MAGARGQPLLHGYGITPDDFSQIPLRFAQVGARRQRSCGERKHETGQEQIETEQRLAGRGTGIGRTAPRDQDAEGGDARPDQPDQRMCAQHSPFVAQIAQAQHGAATPRRRSSRK